MSIVAVHALTYYHTKGSNFIFICLNSVVQLHMQAYLQECFGLQCQVFVLNTMGLVSYRPFQGTWT